jgi:hypothetical protein
MFNIYGGLSQKKKKSAELSLKSALAAEILALSEPVLGGTLGTIGRLLSQLPSQLRLPPPIRPLVTTRQFFLAKTSAI